MFILCNNIIYSADYITTLDVNYSKINNSINTNIEFNISYIKNDGYQNGLSNSIGKILLNYTYSNSRTTSNVVFFDYDLDGVSNEIFLTRDRAARAYYSNGSLIYQINLGDPCYDIWGLESDDLNGNGFDSEIVISCGWSNSPKIFILNRTGGIINDSIGDLLLPTSSVYSINLMDKNNDGVVEHLFISNKCSLVNSSDSGQSWNLVFNKPFSCSDAKFVDIDSDGELEIITTSKNSSYYLVAMELNGTEIWRSYLGNYVNRISVGAFDFDGIKNDFFITTQGNIKIVNESGGVRTMSHNDNVAYRSVVYDIDSNGIDDILYVGMNSKNITARDKDFNLLWTRNMGLGGILKLENIDNNSIPELIYFGVDGNYSVLELNGSLRTSFFMEHSNKKLFSCTTPLSNTYCFGSGDPVDFGDLNKDGSLDSIVISATGEVTVFSEVSCVASFNDSTSYNLDWNNALKNWNFNKMFSSNGTYEVNVNCEKNGYVNQIFSDVVCVGSVCNLHSGNGSHSGNFIGNQSEIIYTYTSTKMPSLSDFSIVFIFGIILLFLI